jgi:hypothetical protein
MTMLIFVAPHFFVNEASATQLLDFSSGQQFTTLQTQDGKLALKVSVIGFLKGYWTFIQEVYGRTLASQVMDPVTAATCLETRQTLR